MQPVEHLAESEPDDRVELGSGRSVALQALGAGRLGGERDARATPRRRGRCTRGTDPAVGPLGLVVPRAVRPIFVAWMVLAFPIGWAISNVVLVALFYGLFTPIGALFRLIGRDPLRLRPQPAGATYWVEKPQAEDARRYFQQF